MTDEAYKAKEWLNRTIDLYNQAEKTAREVRNVEDRINNSVRSYENDGSGRADLIVRQQHREDALIAYSEIRAKYEREYMKFVRQELITIKVLERMKNKRAANLLLMRHINHMSLDKIAASGAFDLKRSQLYELYKKALEELAPLLKREEPNIIRDVEKLIKEKQNQATT